MENLDHIAWNDQNPNGSHSGVKAHSKTVLIFDKNTKKGIVVDHSMPKYPAFTEHIVNVKIADSQSLYGQHFFCFSVSGNEMGTILTKTSIARLYIYESTFDIP